MFQVATYPAHQFQSQGHHRASHLVFEHDDLTPRSPHAHSTFPQSCSNAGLQLPRTLARPPFSEVSRENIAVLAPELADVPAEYTRRGLRAKAPQMLAGVSTLVMSHLPPTMSKHQLPRSVSIPLRAPSGPSTGPTIPTHILAVSAASKGPAAPTSPDASLHPTHALILAAHCSNLPILPPSHPPSSRAHQQGSVTLPVLPISLPSPQTFSLLHYFLYTHDASTLLSQLFPKSSLPPSFLSSVAAAPQACVQQTLASGGKLHQLSAGLSSSARGDLQALMGVAGVVSGVWRNVVALGVSDPELWDVLDLAWEVVLGSLNLAAGV